MLSVCLPFESWAPQRAQRAHMQVYWANRVSFYYLADHHIHMNTNSTWVSVRVLFHTTEFPCERTLLRSKRFVWDVRANSEIFTELWIYIKAQRPLDSFSHIYHCHAIPTKIQTKFRFCFCSYLRSAVLDRKLEFECSTFILIISFLFRLIFSSFCFVFLHYD